MPDFDDDELLLRVWWRRTSLEEPAETIRVLEFESEDGQPDLSPSVYAIAAAEVVQVVTEHFAGNGLQRVKNEERGHLDLVSIYGGQVRKTPGNDWFKRARDAHRELDFADEDGLLEMIRRLVECARHPYAKAEAKSYIQRRVEAGDAEWIRFIRNHENGSRYARFAGV